MDIAGDGRLERGIALDKGDGRGSDSTSSSIGPSRYRMAQCQLTLAHAESAIIDTPDR